MSTQSKAKRYVSLGFDELDLLQGLGWGERAMYLELKRLANFKTGKVGVFRSQALTWEELGRRVSVPSAQGRAAKLVDGKEAALMVGRLEAAGLVADQGRRENGGLTLTLPLSPIEKAAAAAARPARQTSARAAKPGAEAQPEGGEDAGSTLARMPDDWARSSGIWSRDNGRAAICPTDGTDGRPSASCRFSWNSVEPPAYRRLCDRIKSENHLLPKHLRMPRQFFVAPCGHDRPSS